MPPPHTPEQALKIWNRYFHETLIWSLPIADVIKYLPQELGRYVLKWLENPFKKVWHFEKAHHKISVPNLDFTGWYDHCWSLSHFLGLRKNGKTEIARRYSRIIIGPWNHVGLGSRRCGEIDFGKKAEFDLQGLQIKWFDHWLKGIENKIEDEPAVRYFVIGANRWEQSENFPPQTQPFEMYLAGSGSLSFRGPVNSGKFRFVYDPKNPVPTLWTISCFSSAYDLYELKHRQDILWFFPSH